MDDRSAVLIFEGDRVSREMRYTEFEAILDAYAPLPELASQNVRAVYAQLDTRLRPKALVFFLIAFDAEGFADHRWNVPLQQLAESSARGPDLGGGAIKMACRSQCCIEWHKDHLWDPQMGPKSRHFLDIRDAINSNRIGLIAEDEEEVPVLNEAPVAQQSHAQVEQILAQAQKEHQLRVAALNDAHEAAIQALKVKFQSALHEQRQRTEALESDLQRAGQHNQQLKTTIEGQVAKIKGLREYFEHKLESTKASGDANLEDVRRAFEVEQEAAINAAVAELKEQLQVKEVTLMYKETQCSGLEDEVRRLQEDKQTLLANSGNQLLERLHNSGISFVSFQPGYGHMTLPIDDIPEFIDDTDAYVADKCGVDRAHFRAWQEHFKNPVCRAVAKGGLPCGARVARVDRPADFLMGESDRCSLHGGAEESS